MYYAVYILYITEKKPFCTAKIWEETDAPVKYGKKDTCFFLLELHP
jgi:hypothetical protein